MNAKVESFVPKLQMKLLNAYKHFCHLIRDDKLFVMFSPISDILLTKRYFFKNGQNRPLFHLFPFFSNKKYNFYSK